MDLGRATNLQLDGESPLTSLDPNTGFRFVRPDKYTHIEEIIRKNYSANASKYMDDMPPAAFECRLSDGSVGYISSSRGGSVRRTVMQAYSSSGKKGQGSPSKSRGSVSGAQQLALSEDDRGTDRKSVV